MSGQFEQFDTTRINAVSITKVAERLDSVRKSGVNHVTTCPWHDDNHPSLVLFERTNENRCHCFACGKGGSVIDYVMQHEKWTFKDACQWLSREYGILTTQSRRYPTPRSKAKPVATPAEPAYTYIPMELLNELVSVENSLCKCLMHMYQPAAVEYLVEEYRIGCYTMKELDDYTVFPNIDTMGRVCNLKVQHYDTNPHSERFAHSDQSAYWLGKIWSREGRLPKDAEYQSRCLFGEHLLSRYPNSMVALVESPKNALFGALEYPKLVWVATGNKGMLKREVLMTLHGRDVIVIPDCDAVDDWKNTISQMADVANFTVSDFCRHHAPEGQPKFDIADYLQQQHLLPPF